MSEDSQSTKRKINRSAAYPGVTLEKAIEATKQLRDNLGSGPYSRDSAAIALGYNGVSGASVTKVSACVHFGLLTRTGNAYSQASLSDQLFRPTSEEERLAAIRTAALKPTLYAKLVADFDGRALPNMLDNLLVRNYGITERVAKDVSSIFIKSLQYAGVLKNGIVTADNTAVDDVPKDDANLNEEISVDDSRADDTAVEKDDERSKVAPIVSDPDYLTINIPDTDVKIVFPMSYAYDLSIGTFKTGIEALSQNIKGKDDETGDKSAITA